jgi:hypothetical protein
MQERRVSAGKTVALVVGVVGLAAVVAIIVVAKQLEDFCFNCRDFEN